MQWRHRHASDFICHVLTGVWPKCMFGPQPLPIDMFAPICMVQVKLRNFSCKMLAGAPCFLFCRELFLSMCLAGTTSASSISGESLARKTGLSTSAKTYFAPWIIQARMFWQSIHFSLKVAWAAVFQLAGAALWVQASVIQNWLQLWEKCNLGKIFWDVWGFTSLEVKGPGILAWINALPGTHKYSLRDRTRQMRKQENGRMSWKGSRKASQGRFMVGMLPF